MGSDQTAILTRKRKIINKNMTLLIPLNFHSDDKKNKPINMICPQPSSLDHPPIRAEIPACCLLLLNIKHASFFKIFQPSSQKVT
mmetsp:Transcript_51150/g.88023  ORF Transcript_51150/g.88023 Transcript_51150/m.88023 type:complete len:85 (-) Transcript_51150:340-594(-)